MDVVLVDAPAGAAVRGGKDLQYTKKIRVVQLGAAQRLRKQEPEEACICHLSGQLCGKLPFAIDLVRLGCHSLGQFMSGVEIVFKVVLGNRHVFLAL